MANMGYCRFQNTLTDLRDCYEALQDDAWDADNLSKDEAQARDRLVTLCRKIADEYGEEEEQDNGPV